MEIGESQIVVWDVWYAACYASCYGMLLLCHIVHHTLRHFHIYEFDVAHILEMLQRNNEITNKTKQNQTKYYIESDLSNGSAGGVKESLGLTD